MNKNSCYPNNLSGVSYGSATVYSPPKFECLHLSNLEGLLQTSIPTNVYYSACQEKQFCLWMKNSNKYLHAIADSDLLHFLLKKDNLLVLFEHNYNQTQTTDQ